MPILSALFDVELVELKSMSPGWKFEDLKTLNCAAVALGSAAELVRPVMMTNLRSKP